VWRRWPVPIAKFAAIDGAIAEGGWKIVALLRLSPAVPFNLQNYLYGLTPIGFWTCWLTSAVTILPGTFLYIYLGHVAGQGCKPPAARARKSPWRSGFCSASACWRLSPSPSM
jgi:uncharacterized membrane protein YdjX (TVP38/TMEM64 family)